MECDHRSIHAIGAGGRHHYALPGPRLAETTLDAHQIDVCCLADRLPFHLPEQDQTNAQRRFQMELNPTAHLERSRYYIPFRYCFPGSVERFTELDLRYRWAYCFYDDHHVSGEGV